MVRSQGVAGRCGDPGGSFLITQLVGPAKARELYLLDEKIPAQKALEIGLVSEVCPSGELEERAAWVADAIASAPAGPMQATLRTLWAGRELSRKQALDLGNTFLNLGMSEESLAEGQKVFQGTRIEPRVR